MKFYKFTKNKILCFVFFLLLPLIKLHSVNTTFFDRSCYEKMDRRAEIAARREYRTKLREDLSTLQQKLNTDLTEAKKKEISKEIELIKAELYPGKGKIIFKGIAGKHWQMIEDETVTGVINGFIDGATLRATLALGDAIGDSLEGYIKDIFANTVGKLAEGIKKIYRFFFNNSRKPFTSTEINCWKKLIFNDLKEIDIMVKNAERTLSRSRESFLRDDSDKKIKTNEKKTLNLWKDYTSELASTCVELAQEIEFRQGYYKDCGFGFGINACSKHLSNKLLKVKDWLLSVQSLKDFSTIPEIKSTISAMKKSLENYFIALNTQIQPIDSESDKINLNKKGLTTRYSGLGSDYPHKA